MAGAESVTERSAETAEFDVGTDAGAGAGAGATTVPDAVAELLAAVGSEVVVEMVAVSLKAEPAANDAGAVTTIVNVSLAPEAKVPFAVAVAVPPDCDSVKASEPAVCVVDTKTAPDGRASESTIP